MGAWKVKSTNKNDSGIAREEEAREGTKARLPQRSTIIAFPTAGNVQVSLLGRRNVKGKRGRAKWRKGKGRAASFPLFINPLSFFPFPLSSLGACQLGRRLHTHPASLRFLGRVTGCPFDSNLSQLINISEIFQGYMVFIV